MLAIDNGALTQKRPPPPHPQTILLAEDDSVVRELVARQLQRAGYSVLKARHSDEAIQFNRDFDGPIHLLLTDLCMAPHRNGRELAGLIRPTRPGMRVLYISGFVDDDVVVDEIEHGLANFLPKPFTPDILLESVRMALVLPLETGQVRES